MRVLIKLGLVLFFTCIVGVENVSADQAHIKIGAIFALTGPGSVWGNAALKGARLAVDEINNSQAEVKIEFFVENSLTEAKAGVSAFKKLVEVDSADVVVGDVWTFITAPLIPLAEQSKRLLISPTVVDSSIEYQGDCFYTLGGQVKNIQKSLDQFFSQNGKQKTVSIIYWDDPWGTAYLEQWKDKARAHGNTIEREYGVLDWNFDYGIEVKKAALHKSEIFVFAHHSERVMRKMQEVNYSPVVLTTSNIVESLTSGALPWELANGVFFTDFVPNAEFVTKYKSKYNEVPILEAQNSYDAIKAILLAHKANANDLANGIKTVKFNGTSGPIDFTHGMAANDSEAVLRVIKGRTIETVPMQ